MSILTGRAALAAAVAMSGLGSMGGAKVIERPMPIPDSEPRIRMPWQKRKGRRSNDPARQRGARKAKRIAKIARASRRYNLRHGF